MLNDLRKYIILDKKIDESLIGDNTLLDATIKLMERTPLQTTSKQIEDSIITDGKEASDNAGCFSILDNLAYSWHVQDFLDFDGSDVLKMICSSYTDKYKLEILDNGPIEYLYMEVIEGKTPIDRIIREQIESWYNITEEQRKTIQEVEDAETVLCETDMNTDDDYFYLSIIKTENEKLKSLLNELAFADEGNGVMLFLSAGYDEGTGDMNINFDKGSLEELCNYLSTLPIQRKVSNKFIETSYLILEEGYAVSEYYYLKKYTFSSDREVIF